jgi:hypothetical protein
VSITNPDSNFRLMVKVWAGNYKGEQPFYSATQKNLMEVLRLVKAIQASPLHAQVRSYVLQEDLTPEKPRPTWKELDYSDWSDLI